MASSLQPAPTASGEPSDRLQRITRLYPPAQAAIIQAAAEYGGSLPSAQPFVGGEPAPEHALETATLLSGLHLDHESVATALLLAVAPETDARALRERFGAGIAGLLEGVRRMGQIEALSGAAAGKAQPAAQLEGLRKMLLAMVQDVRVVLIQLASYTQSLRFVVKSEDQDARRHCAALALDIFAPLANRLGLWQLKWELEDLAFRIAEPDTYKEIARLLDEKRVERQRFIDEVITALQRETSAAGVRAEITGRPKHIYSIYKKMQRKELDFDEIYDVSAVRVLVDEVRDCYAVLGLVHNMWTPIPKEFDDYIAKPKGNDYRSLHTAVIGPGARALEVQIRTREMHRDAELGVAAHWRYKEGTRRDSAYDDKVSWLRQVLAWKDEMADSAELAERLHGGLFDDTIYVLTPQGRVVDLPRGSTPVDFAYHVHSDLGHRCRGARVDGAIVPLSTPLDNGQCVEIVAAKQGGPSRDWLNPALGFLKSARARAKVRQWFNAQNLDAALAQGRALVEKELQRAGRTALNLEAFAHELGYDKLEAFLVDVGRGEIGHRQLQLGLRALVEPQAPESKDVLPLTKKSSTTVGSGILVVGVDKLLTVPARCCKPAPPDPIVGFVTRGRGVTIHRQACTNVQTLPRERMIEAQWGRHEGVAFGVDIEVEAGDRTGLLRDISECLSREKINVTGANTLSRDLTARMFFTIEISDLGQLARVLKQIEAVPGVLRAIRR